MAAPKITTRKHECKWCGAAYTLTARAYDHQRSAFCSTAHKTAFNNLRLSRSVQLYDLFMANSFERGAPERKSGQLRRAMGRLASRWRDEDHAARDGRKSWGDWRQVLDLDRTLTISQEYGTPWTGGRAVTEQASTMGLSA